MCLSPITIPNQTKYISLRHCDSFLLQVPCGHCSECQKTLSQQWYYRAYYEWFELSSSNGYVLFDTLTYSNKHLPKLSNTWSMLQPKDDFPCFDFTHIRKFLQALFLRVKRAGYGNCLRYFISSEYGTHETYKGRMCTHRPHYHLLLYVYNDKVDPLWLSRQISDLWLYGRTDGLPYKSSGYILGKNVIGSASPIDSKLRTCYYVTKYVQKSCAFQSEIDKRKNKVMFALANVASPVDPYSWLDSEYAHREWLKLNRLVNQFHRQSQGFGATALRDMDISQVLRDGCLYMPDFKNIRIPIPLPMYYKRKLCQDLIEFNGSRYWVDNDFGKEYRLARKHDNSKRLFDRYNAVCSQYHLDYDVSKLVDYVLNYRGRIKGDLPESTLIDRIDSIDYINYSSSSDKLNFGHRGITLDWLGDSQQGYVSDFMSNDIGFAKFIKKYVYFDKDLENQLDSIFFYMRELNDKKQRAFALQQHLTQVYKFVSSVCTS